MAAGCTDYLTKPVDEDLLLQKLAQLPGINPHDAAQKS